MNIGVLSLQGGFSKHSEAIEQIGAHPVAVRDSNDLNDIEGLILPGGESTTIGMLMKRRGLDSGIRNFLAAGNPVMGTCAGMILLGKQVDGRSELHFDALDIRVQRNWYGSQVHSFEGYIDIYPEGEPSQSAAGHNALPVLEQVPGVFIRAPRVAEWGASVTVHGRFNNDPVIISQGNVLALSFHPELTDDKRVHQFFVSHFVQKITK